MMPNTLPVKIKISDPSQEKVRMRDFFTDYQMAVVCVPKKEITASHKKLVAKKEQKRKAKKKTKKQKPKK